jgi:hypothetical protein
MIPDSGAGERAVIALSRLVPVSLALIALAASTARADDPSAPSPTWTPTPSDSPLPFVPADVTRENDPRVQTVNLQGAYTGATYGPGNARASQVLTRVAPLYIGRSVLRLTLPRVMTINGRTGGITDMQAFYIGARPLRAGVTLFGMSAQFPTASTPQFGTGKWLVGPTVVFIFRYQPRRSTAGTLVQTGFSVAGPSHRPNQSVVTVLPFCVVDLGRSWYVRLPESPWVFDLQRGRSLIPLGLGIGRKTRIGPDPAMVAITDETTVIRANTPNAPKNTVRLMFTLIIHDPARQLEMEKP